MIANFNMIAKTSFGFEELLADELKEMGARNIKILTRAVMFEGNQKLMYMANYKSRVALRILKPLGSFPCPDEQSLYEGMKKINWSEYMDAEDTLSIDSVVSRSSITHSLYASQKAKDAIVDQFRNRQGTRPGVDTKHPSLRINLHISGDVANVALDSSGESLHKRGYRKSPGDAPLNETLAAAMVLLSGWDKKSPLVDLMCGSGTILIEAGLIARNIAPGKFRYDYGFQKWKDYSEELFNDVTYSCTKEELNELGFKLTGIDKHISVIRQAEENVKSAGLQNEIDLKHMSFQDFQPDENPGMVICNPPYGGRITSEDLFELYREIGETFKKKFTGGTGWLLTANREASHKIGLRPSRKIPLFNGALECRFMKFEMYSGSKKLKKQ
ncbi:MAG: hypothetical protein DWQ44_12520 [Bacteroidetes bacterium]|nr:MAG: hypothetical protein DWQ33_07485 [Bacteroidota bacterium]REK08100.1 MAG: hypothetical protein DWQ39_00665 [Bacteroidota bacterium]REK32305.1 MAG: hypothetical protein DWQ44_12520 [Bacteroidota bacterium]REK49539.1 MAG: hypothetical protein DWQ48_06980 [Bacteroidota bacterium]